MSSATGNTDPTLTILTILFFAWALLIYLGRVWTKIGKTGGWSPDDTLISISLGVAAAQVATLFIAVHRGYGDPWADLATDDSHMVLGALYAAQLLFTLSTCLTRASCGYFTGRALSWDQNHPKLNTRLSYAFALWTAASLFVIALRAPLSRPWTTLDGAASMFYRWLVVELAGGLIDLSALAATIYFISRLHMSFSKRLLVCCLFAIRPVMYHSPIVPQSRFSTTLTICSVTVIAALRLGKLAPTGPGTDATPLLEVSILTEAEMLFAIFFASVTCLKPVLKPFRPGQFVGTTGVVGLTNYSVGGSKEKSYRELSNSRTRSRSTGKGTQRSSNISATLHTTDDDASDRIDLISMGKTLPGTFRPDHVEHRASARAVPADPSRNFEGGIAATQTWSVEHE